MSVIDEFFEYIDPPERSELQRIRNIVHETVPDAVEVISYGMPGFKYKGKYLITFNAWKDHLSLFPGAEAVEVLRDKLQDYSLSKGTIRFTLDSPLPEPLIKDILLVRVADILKS
jgi:uncharacterized protein YdhG (YjbR/CyaY superfamily)